ncbi:flap endonuclease Xni [Celerinatantimonas sp. YJH-8]|uniref:flap endonuclease Xni n=1 Tax=Celerinatantimonas sp. YJH-8 TaxID=3228714 RepID=UPI0038C373D9
MIQQLLIIDALNLIRRFYAVSEKQFQDPKALLAATFNQTHQGIIRLLQQFNPSHVVTVFDSGQPDWRQQIDPQYKANREPMPQPLKDALTSFQDQLLDVGIDSLSNPGIQADDLIATLACKADSHQLASVIVSTDQGYWQLLDHPFIQIYDYFKRQFIDAHTVYEKFQLQTQQLIDYWAMIGSSSVNLKGVPGIGPKSALKLLHQYQTLHNILQLKSQDRLVLKVQQYHQEAKQTAQLMQLQTQLSLGFKLNQIRYHAIESS